MEHQHAACFKNCHPQVCNLNPSETSVCRLGNGGPFAGFGNADVTFVPPSNITTMNSVTTDMAAGLKSESISTTRSLWLAKLQRTHRLLARAPSLVHSSSIACFLVLQCCCSD